MKNRAIILCRISEANKKASQQTTATSIKAQLKITEDYASQQGYNVIAVYKEQGITGSISKEQRTVRYDEENKKIIVVTSLKQRKGLIKVMDHALKKEFDTLIITRWDRLGRDTTLQQSIINFFKQQEITVKPVLESEEPIIRDITAVINHNEASRVKKRRLSSAQAMYKLGIYPYRPYFGYVKKPEKLFGEEYNVMTPHKKKSLVVKHIFALLISEQQANHALFQQENKTHQISPPTYYNVLKHTHIYAGYLLVDGNLKKGVHEPLITQEQYRKAKLIIAGKKVDERPVKKYTKEKLITPKQLKKESITFSIN